MNHPSAIDAGQFTAPDSLDNARPEPEQKPADRQPVTALPKEINGPKGPEPTRFGDWERKGRCVDF